MKKFLALLLALLMCVGVLASCGGNTDDAAATLDEAKELLNSMMKDKNGKATPNDYDVVGKLTVGETTFEVTWKTDKENIKIKASSKKDFWTVDVPDVNEAEVEYKLTATIKAEDGSTVDVTFTPKLPVVNNAGVASEFEAGVAYVMFMKQANLGYTVYALNTTQNGENKYIETTMDPKAAAVYYVEPVDGGYKLYTEINGVKNYLHAELKTTGEGATAKTSKYIGLKADSNCVFTYDKELTVFKITLNGGEYGVGTYNAFETISLSDATYFKKDNINVEGGQFPVGLMTKAHADTLAPSEKPANNDPKADSTLSIADAIALGNSKAKGVYTEGKYYVEGTVKEIQNDVYGNIVITDGTNDLLIYGTYSEDGKTRFDKLATKPAVGDKIKVYGVIGKYNDAQMQNGWIIGAAAGEGDDDNGGSTIPAGKNYINMVVSGTHVNGAYEATASTVYTMSADLKTIFAAITGTTDASKDGDYAFGTRNDKSFTTMGPVYADATKSFIAQFYNADGTVVESPVAGTAYKFGMVQTAAGKTVYLKGGMDGYYMATSENIAEAIDVYLEATEGGFYFYTETAENNGGSTEGGNTEGGNTEGGNTEGGNTEGGNTEGGNTETITESTIEEVLAKAVGENVVVSGIVIEASSWNSDYNNMSVTIVDANCNELYVYRTSTEVAVGDYITVTGTVGEYGGAKQIAQGSTAVIGTADDAHKAAFEAMFAADITTSYSKDVEVVLPFESLKFNANLVWTKDDVVVTELNIPQTSDVQTVTIKVTATVGTASATKEVTITVTAKVNTSLNTLATFNFGENVTGDSIAHVDGSTKFNTAGETFTDGSYSLVIDANSANVYVGANDAKGNSCIKLGTSSKAATFSFTVGADVTQVVIRAAKYKANNSTLNVNGTDYSLTKNSNDGEYDEIIIDTTTTKTITVSTVSGGYRAMIDAIIFKG